MQAGAQRKRRSTECKTQQRSPRRHASSSKRRAAIAAAARRRPRPAAGAQGTCQGRASSTGTPATTTRTTMQPVSSAAASVCKRRRQKFHFRGAYGRQGERGARAHTVVWSVAGMSRIVELAAPHEDRRALGLLILTNGQQRRVSNKLGVRSIHPAGDARSIRVRCQGIGISWCAKHAEGCVLARQAGGECLAAGMCGTHIFL